MGSTRHATQLTPIKIFNDSFDDEPLNAHSHALSSPLDNKPDFSPNGNVLAPRTDSNTRLIPPSQAGRSPSKNGHRGTSPPLKHGISHNSHTLLPTPQTLHSTDSLVKKPSPGSFQNIAPHLAPKTYNFALSGNGQDKENIFPSSYMNDNFAEFPGPEDGTKINNKRPRMDTPSAFERPSKLARPSPAPAPLRIPEPHEMPQITDNGMKPKYSYATLIGMAILRAPERKLMLSEIYKWIMQTFKHYRDSPQPGWQNSIRHNLSLHKSFIKVERPRNDPGKGSYWIIDPPKIPDFLEEKHCRRPTSSHTASVSASVSTQPQHHPPPQPAANQHAMQPPAPRRPSTSLAASARSCRPHQTCEPSSDATIPLSDPALLEEDGEETLVDIPRPSSRRASSPQLKSSPPVAFARSRSGTAADLLSSVHGSRKRKSAALNDSGYYSSIESSAMRRPSSRTGLDSLAGKRNKSGRAELEIMRLRNSSQDISPSKNVPHLGVPRKPTPSLLSSSPTRLGDMDADLLLDAKPLLPRPKPTVSAVSPETQLRNHRSRVSELISTPMKGIHDVPTAMFDLSPVFNIDGGHFDFGNTPNLKFSIFDDQSPLKTRSTASSQKSRSATRPGMLRSTTTPGGSTLRDVTNSMSNRATPTALKPPITFSRLGSPLRLASPEKGDGLSGPPPGPLLSSPFKDLFVDMKSPGKGMSPIKWSSPSKFFLPSGNESPSKAFDLHGFGNTNDNFFSFELFNDEAKQNSPLSQKSGGFDLAGGFQKIGEEAHGDKENMGPPPKKAKNVEKKRPTMGGRSSTSFI